MADKFKKLIAVLLILIFAVLFDQATKFWAENNFASVRYPDHQIEVTVTPDQADLTLEEFVKKNYDSLNDEDALRVTSSATRNGERLRATDKLAADDKVAFNHLSKTVVDGYFDYQYARNPGAAWSFMADKSATFRAWFFGITGIIAMIALGIFIGVSKWKTQKPLIIALACVMGGALGNIIDRFRLTYVIDFISWHIGEHYWPTFNIADVFVTCGIAFLIIDVIIHGKDEKKNKDTVAQEETPTADNELPANDKTDETASNIKTDEIASNVKTDEIASNDEKSAT